MNCLGSFIFEQGTVNANNLNIAYKQGTNASSCVNSGSSTPVPCVVTVKSNAVLTVNSDLTIAYRNGDQGDAVTAVNTPYGQLNVNDSAVVNVGGNITSSTNSVSWIQLAGGTINMTNGNVSISKLTGSGTISGAGTVMIYSNLSPGGDFNAGFNGPIVTGIGTLNIGGNLIYSNSANSGLVTNPAITFDLGTTNTTGASDLLNVTNDLWLNNNPVSFTFGGPLLVGSNYTLVTYGGTLHGALVIATNQFRPPTGFYIDYSQTNKISLHVTNWTVGTLTWAGTNLLQTNVNWDLATTNWLNGQVFYQGDNVVFDDTARSGNVKFHGLLSPSSITINGETNFFIDGGTAPFGNISGNCSIIINGSGTNTFSSYSNGFTGPIYVNNGVFRTADSTGQSGANTHPQSLGAYTGAIYVTNGATFDLNGLNGSVAVGKQLHIRGNGYLITTTNLTSTNLTPIGVITNSPASPSAGSVMGFAVTMDDNCYINPDFVSFGFGGANPFFASGNLAAPYSGLFNLNGFNLTKMGAKNFILRDSVANGNGDIYIGKGALALVNSRLGGTGNLIFSNNTVLTYGYGSSANGTVTTNNDNYINKPVTFYNAAITAPSIGLAGVIAGAGSANINAAVTNLGNLTVSNWCPVVFNGTLTEGAGGPYSLAKYGTGNLTFNAAAGYGGITLINAGTLTVGSGGSLPNTLDVYIAPGATMDHSGAGTFTLNRSMDLEGTFLGSMTVAPNATLFGQNFGSTMVIAPITGSLTLQAGANVALGGTNNTGQITVGGSLTMNGANFTWDCGPSFGTSDGITVTNGLNLSGTNIFNINAIGGFSPTGTNVLIKYAVGQLVTNVNTRLIASNNGARYVLQMVDPAATPGQICVKLITPSPLLTWVGDVANNPTNWDVKITSNWIQNGTNDIFFTSDLVQFDDTASNCVVNVAGPVGPMNMTFQNVTSNYVFNGKGAITTSTITNVMGASITFSNLGNNFVTGTGIVLNTNTITFAQPNTNGTLVSDLYGNSGSTFNKDGTNNLTLTANGSGFGGTFNIKNGTLSAGTWAAGTTNYLGTGTVNIGQSGANASLDLKGNPVMSPSMVNVSGVGFDGNGVINNRGAVITNALSNVTLTGDTTFGALSNAWGISTSLAGGGHNLTKTNASDVFIQTGSSADLGNVTIGQGRLIFANPGTTWDGAHTGANSSNIYIWPGAALGLMPTNFAMITGNPFGVDWGSRSLYLSNNAAIEAFYVGGVGGTNLLDGSVSIITNGTAIMRVADREHLVFNGPISGSASNIASIIVTNSLSSPSAGNVGTVWLWGTNTYFGNTLVYQGQLNVYNSNSIPDNTTLIASNNTAAGSPFIELGSNGIYNATKTLRLSLFNSAAGIQGDGTWLGPIYIHGSNNILQINLPNKGSNGLYLAGPLITTNRVATSTNLTSTNFIALAGSIQFHGVNTRIAYPLNLSVTDPHLNISIGHNDGGGAGFNENFTTVELDSPNNWQVINNFERGRLVVGTNDAFGTNIAIVTVGNLFPMVDHRCIIDLNGYNQSVSYMQEVNNVDMLDDMIGNSSSNFDSTLTYGGSGTNTWVFRMMDTLGTPLTPRKLNLSVTNGCLELYNTNTYTGPTTVSGAALLVEVLVTTNIIPALNLTNCGSLGATLVTVNAGGTFGGNGSVGGNVMINAGGTLTPGDLYGWTNQGTYPIATTNFLISKIGGPLTMSAGSTLTLGAGSTGIFDVDNYNGTNDSVVGAGTVIIGGTFVINSLSVAPYTNTQAIPLFQGFTNISGTVPTITPPYPGNHLVWDTSTLLTDGNLRLAAGPTNAPTMTSAVSGGNLTISWPADHLGWTLQSQTNALNKGLKSASTNWFDIPSTANVTSMTIPTTRTNPTVFYRLRY
jgi:autotransporter-associated beta strand protein